MVGKYHQMGDLECPLPNKLHFRLTPAREADFRSERQLRMGMAFPGACQTPVFLLCSFGLDMSDCSIPGSELPCPGRSVRSEPRAVPACLEQKGSSAHLQQQHRAGSCCTDPAKNLHLAAMARLECPSPCTQSCATAAWKGSPVAPVWQCLGCCRCFPTRNNVRPGTASAAGVSSWLDCGPAEQEVKDKITHLLLKTLGFASGELLWACKLALIQLNCCLKNALFFQFEGLFCCNWNAFLIACLIEAFED